MVGLDPLSADLVGRERELGLLEQHVKAAVSGERRAIVLVGPPGIGKTTLLRWCVGRLATERVALATVRVPTAAGLPPRYPIGEILTGLRRSAERLKMTVPEPLARAQQALERLDPQNPFPISLPQVADAIESIGERLPVAILIDDWHAVPTEGGELLLAALRVIGTPLFLAVAAREGGPSASADLTVQPLRLDGLQRDELPQLVRSELGGQALPSLVDALHSHTGGNPLLARLALMEWQEANQLQSIGDYWGTIGEPLATSLGDLQRSKMENLSRSALAVAYTIAISGCELTFTDLERILGAGRTPCVSALSELEAAQLLSAGSPGAAYRFSHPSLESLVQTLLTASERSLLHQQLYEVLSKSPHRASAAERAHHAMRGIEPPSNLAALIGQAGAESRAIGSYEESAHWYGELAAISKVGKSERLSALMNQGTALLHVHPGAAIEAFAAGLSGTQEPHVRVDFLIGLATAKRRTGDLSGALADLRAAGAAADSNQAIRIKNLLAPIHGILGNLEDVEKILNELLKDEPTGDSLAGILCDLSVICAERSELPRGIELAARARQMAESPATIVAASINEGWLRAVIGQWDNGIAIHRDALRIAQETGDAWNRVGLQTNLGILMAWRGSFREAYDHCLAALRDVRKLNRPMDRIELLDALGTVHLESGNTREAAEVLSEAASLLDLETETYDVPETLSNLAEACRRLGDLNGADQRLREAAQRGLRPEYLRLKVARVRAACLTDQNRAEETISELHDALEQRWAFDPYERAQCFEVLSRAAARLGNSESAERLRHEAWTAYQALGSQHSAARCSRDRRKRRGRPRISGLSAREEEVASLVAAGMTDKEIAGTLLLSARTVSKHVSSILSKLGARRRSQITTYILTRS